MTFSVVPRDKQQVLALVETELGSYILFGVCAVVVPSPIIQLDPQVNDCHACAIKDAR